MMSKKKYFKTIPKNCKAHKNDYCTCMISGHRYWMSKKYYGWDNRGDFER